jgi:hypothetical protein
MAGLPQLANPLAAVAGAAPLCYWGAELHSRSVSPAGLEALQQQVPGQQQQRQHHQVPQMQLELAQYGTLGSMGSMQLLQPHLGAAALSGGSWGAAQPCWGDLSASLPGVLADAEPADSLQVEGNAPCARSAAAAAAQPVQGSYMEMLTAALSASPEAKGPAAAEPQTSAQGACAIGPGRGVKQLQGLSDAMVVRSHSGAQSGVSQEVWRSVQDAGELQEYDSAGLGMGL